MPSAFTETTGRAHWETLMRARAIENLAYVLAPAQGGYHVNGRETHGHTMIVDPWGVVLDRLPRGSGVVIAGVNPNYQKELRDSLPALTHRTIRTYRPRPRSLAFADHSIQHCILNAPAQQRSPFCHRRPHVAGPVRARRSWTHARVRPDPGHQVDYADLYFQYSRGESWSLEEGIVKSGSFNIDQGVGVRAVSGEKTAFAYSDDISLPALECRRAGHPRDRAPGRQAGSTRGARGATMAARFICRTIRSPRSRTHEKVALLERLERMARALDPRVTQVMASLAGEYEVVLVARTDGVLGADVRPLVRLSLQVIVEENGRREQGSAGGGGRFDYDYFSDEVLQQLRREGGAPGAHQSRGASGAGRQHDRGAGPRLARHPAARGGRPRSGRRFQPQGQLGLLRPHRRARGRARA